MKFQSVKSVLARRLIYIAVILTVFIPLAFKVAIAPARLKSAEAIKLLVDELPNDSFGMLFFDFGPSTRAENEPQAEVILEHLLRRRVRVAIFTLLPLAEGFLKSVPERVIKRLEAEMPGEKWVYGVDWINMGYRIGDSLFLQGLAKSDDIPKYLGKDFSGLKISDLKVFANVKTLRDIDIVGQFSGVVGIFDSYIQFLQQGGYIPTIIHGCTSITIPEAYIYLDSGQLKGILEGLSGAAWYSKLLKDTFQKREPDQALLANTALGFSQMLVLILIALGNLNMMFKGREG
jgi:hypothetical protein